MRKYFDLNDRAQRALKNNGDAVPFPGTGDCSPDSVEQESEPGISVAHQLVMYIGTFIGVLLSTAVTHFRSGTLELTITVGEVALSAVIALVIIPLVYEKLMLNPRAPLIVQFGLFVQNGVFWHVLIDSIGSVL
ncbi:MAG: hypothetical protein HXS46_00255 [Theionarchaea archaeon]|nr:hypothetical protein [Theionarchaea archaeon]